MAVLKLINLDTATCWVISILSRRQQAALLKMPEVLCPTLPNVFFCNLLTKAFCGCIFCWYYEGYSGFSWLVLLFLGICDLPTLVRMAHALSRTELRKNVFQMNNPFIYISLFSSSHRQFHQC